jgi:hypothetical protein
MYIEMLLLVNYIRVTNTVGQTDIKFWFSAFEVFTAVAVKAVFSKL